MEVSGEIPAYVASNEVLSEISTALNWRWNALCHAQKSIAEDGRLVSEMPDALLSGKML